MCGPLLAVEMSKKCTPLWREALFEVKMYKTHHCRPPLEVEMSKKCMPSWRNAIPVAPHRAMVCNIRDLSHGTNGHASEGGFSLGGDVVYTVHHG